MVEYEGTKQMSRLKVRACVADRMIVLTLM